GLPVLSRISAATWLPVAVSRTASVTAAPAPASARAVSTPMPDAAPVTTAAVDSEPKGVAMGEVMSLPNTRRSDAVPRRGDCVLSLLGVACDQGARGVQFSD